MDEEHLDSLDGIAKIFNESDYFETDMPDDDRQFFLRLSDSEKCYVILASNKFHLLSMINYSVEEAFISLGANLRDSLQWRWKWTTCREYVKAADDAELNKSAKVKNFQISKSKKRHIY
ncbi:MAG: hypothetical protein H7Z73_10415 [Candidatus Saccharibacteria bacterium]|nr:hypothetical protein [Moraxellaceae bacterium]